MRLFLVASLLSILFFVFFACNKSSDDTVKPWIELKGYNPVYTEKGKSYEDAGAIAWDVNGAGDTVDITGRLKVYEDVNTDVIGKYNVRYNVSDDVGNSADEVVRTVYVQVFK